ncbi:MAG: hypothetical protein R3F20_12380 [Planctomycetota bacterium]
MQAERDLKTGAAAIRLALAVALPVAALLCGLLACGSKDDGRKTVARSLAQQFHNAALDGDVATLLTLVDYPFMLDDQKSVFASEAELEKALQARLPTMRRHMRAANYLEVLTFEEFVEGAPIQGKSYSEEKARERAKIIRFAEGGILVRLHFRDKEDATEDGRGYFLVMRANSVGDLKISTYTD